MGKVFRVGFILTFLVCVFFTPSKVEGQRPACPGQGIQWEQARTQDFAILYPKDSGGQDIINSLQPQLDAQYSKFATIFESSLLLPVNIRLYPAEADFYCLNSGVVKLPKGVTHASVGNREIALILGNFPGSGRSDQALNAYRYELAALFVQQITDRKALPGLAAGVGGYAQDPQFFVNTHPKSGLDQAAADWRQVWDNSNVPGDPQLSIEATSITAYLVDVYGWPNFLSFLKNLATASDYHQALTEVYNPSIAELQDQWQVYVPYYLQGRWRAHAFYSFDLTSIEKLITEGAYEDAASSLTSAIEFLKSIEANDKVNQAEALLKKAQTGQDAAALMRQARQAILEQRYEDAIALTEQARARYAELQDTRREAELAAYQEWAREVQDLRKELKTIDARVQVERTYAPAARLQEIGKRLGELGDDEGRQRANTLLQMIDQRTQQMLLAQVGIGLLVMAALLVWRILLLRRKPRPEVLL